MIGPTENEEGWTKRKGKVGAFSFWKMSSNTGSRVSMGEKAEKFASMTRRSSQGG